MDSPWKMQQRDSGPVAIHMMMIACLALNMQTARAACEQQVSLPAQNFDGSFGAAVAIRGDRAVVGAPASSGGVGAAIVFRFDGALWSVEQVLEASGPDAGTPRDFGAAVALHNQWIVVGAQRSADQGTNAGSAFIFRHDGTAWVQHQKLLPIDIAQGDQFGNAVAISGDTILVAACGDNAPAPDSGSAYVYTFDGTNWVQQQNLVASDAAAGDFLGRSLALHGDAAILGADGDDDLGSAAGAAYIFRHDGIAFVQEQKLHAPDGAAFDSFGWATSISDDVALVGSFRDDDSGSSSGSAHVFRFDGTLWAHEQKLIPASGDGAANDLFGISVSIAGDRAIIGASLDDDRGEDSGSAYCFRLDGARWTQFDKLTATEGNAFAGFGASVSLWGDAALAGSWNDNDPPTITGAAHVVTNRAGDCNANNVADYCDVISGASADANADGWPDECKAPPPPPNCPADIAPAQQPNGAVDVDDLIMIIVNWGDCAAPKCAADIAPQPPHGGDGQVNVDDLLMVINAWGPCQP